MVKDFAYYSKQNYLYDKSHGNDPEERKKSMKSFFAENNEVANDVSKVRGFTKVRALLMDFENDSAFDVSVFDVNSDTSPKIS